MNPTRRLRPLALLLPLSLLTACAGTHFQSPIVVTSDAKEQRVGPGKLTPSGVQSEVMSFSDTFTSAIGQIWNAIATNARNASSAGGLTDAENAKQNRIRRAALEIKLANTNASLLIASSPNPMVALADMITLVTLQRMVIEAPSTRKTFGEEIQGQLLEVYKEQEINVWDIADQAMTEKQRDELRAMISSWRADHPDATYVSSIRMDDFAAARQVTIMQEDKRDPSLLSILSLDPLAGLDPAQKEVTKSRMLAERIFFYASRVPNVLKWQVESLYQGLMQSPEVADVMKTARTASEAADQLADVAAKLPEQITREREELLHSFFAELSKERSATIAQINDALSLQRQSALKDLEGAQGQFQSTLKDFRDTAAGANTLAEKLTATIEAADKLASRFAPVGGSPAQPPKDGDSIEDIKQAIEKTATAADRLTQLTKSIDQLLASPALNSKSGSLQNVVNEVQLSGRELVNYAFWRLLIVVLVAPFAVVVAMVTYKKLAR